VTVLSDEGYALSFGSEATPVVKSSFDLAVRPHLQDVRAMLRLPLPDVGITAGCNFAAVHVLLNVLSGMSRVMPHRTDHRSQAAFERFVRRWYPWALEPHGSTHRQKHGTSVLYGSFRTGFSHDLGLLVEQAPSRKRRQPVVAAKQPKAPLVGFRFRVRGRHRCDEGPVADARSAIRTRRCIREAFVGGPDYSGGVTGFRGERRGALLGRPARGAQLHVQQTRHPGLSPKG
jgi:hypothetical protein